MRRYILQRLREPSSLAGLGALAMVFGAAPDQVNAVTQLVGAALAAAAVFLPDGK